MARPKMLTFRGVGLSADVGEVEGVEGSTTVPVLDGVEGSTTVPVLDGMEGSTTIPVLDGMEGSTTMPVLDGVEGSTTMPVLDGVEGSTTMPVLEGVEGVAYRTCESTTKSTMRHKSTMVLPNPSMCELDLRHLHIYLPQQGFQSSYRRNRGQQRTKRGADESRRRAPRHCRCRAPPLCRYARYNHGFRSTKGTSSIWEKWRVWISAVSAELNKGPKERAVTEILLPLFRYTAWARAISAAYIRSYAVSTK
jgi:hypothetical protein